MARTGLWALVTAAVFTVIGAVGAVAFYNSVSVPTETNDIGQTTVVYYDDGTTELGRFATNERVPVPSEQIPEHVKQMFVAAEDTTFYDNSGISLMGIARAAYGNLFKSGATQGGSTITQQYVKVNYLTADRTYSRKAKEIVIALKVEQQKSKDEILTEYLNSVYLGRGVIGVEAAAEAYFGVSASELTPSQAAMLAGITPSANQWDPAKRPEKAKQRWEYTLDRAVGAGFITASERSSMTFPELPNPEPDERFAGPNGYLLQMVRDELGSKSDGTDSALGTNDRMLETGGLKIVTTINKTMQDDAVATIQDTDVFNPNRDNPDEAGVQAGLVTLDPATGGIKALYGGADYLTSQLNGSTQQVAQGASTFKPFALIGGLEEGIALKTEFDGRSGQTFPGFTDPSGTPKKVENYGNTNYGVSTLETALQKSMNTPFVKLNEMIGPEKTRDVALRLGVSETESRPFDTYLGNVLGTHSVTTMDMARAYGTIANNGVRNDSHIVGSVEFPDGRVANTDPHSAKVVEDGVVADATYAMSLTTRSGGTASSVTSKMGRPVAGKTGTSSSNMSAWFIGFTPQLVTAVSLYNYQDVDGVATQRPVKVRGAKQTGGKIPATIWVDYMKKAMEGMPVEQLPAAARVGSKVKVPGVTVPTKTPTETATSTETETEEPEETATPTETATSTATSTPTATSTATPSVTLPTGTMSPTTAPTATVTAPPTAAPSGRNNNDDNNDNG